MAVKIVKLTDEQKKKLAENFKNFKFTDKKESVNMKSAFNLLERLKPQKG